MERHPSSSAHHKTCVQHEKKVPGCHQRLRIIRLVTDYLKNFGVDRMDWPANSPDLNPMEHLWDQLGFAVRARTTNTSTVADLTRFLNEEWNANSSSSAYHKTCVQHEKKVPCFHQRLRIIHLLLNFLYQ